jgi:CcmD family protein
MMIRRLLMMTVATWLTAVHILAAQPPAGQSEFVPISQLPPADQLPAAPLLVGAYAFIWLAVMFYLWSIWRRLNRVETEMHALARKTERR